MDTYNHFEYGEQLAIKLKPISHTPETPRFFVAFGVEDLFTFEDKLSSVIGTVLIAVDGYESDSKGNGADALNDTRMYGFIVAKNTVSDRIETIKEAFNECRQICKQIRNKLFQDERLAGMIDRDTQINGIGPIGDNFYGCMLSYSIQESEDFLVDETFWNE